MEVDAKGTYFFYITDIFGNINSQAKQKVDNVMNRTIYTKIAKEIELVKQMTGDMMMKKHLQTKVFKLH